MGRRRALAYDRDETVKRRLQRVETESSREEANPVHGELLRLQQGGGNEAVAGVLARDDAVAADKKTGPKETGQKPPRTMQIDGIGEVPLLSASSPDKDRNEIQVAVPGDSPFVVELQKRAASGGNIGKVVIDFGYFTWTLYDVYISSLQISTAGGEPGPVSMSLNYGKMSIGSVSPDQPGSVE